MLEYSVNATGAQSDSLFGRLARNSYVHLAVLMLLGLLVYSNTFHAPFFFDDMAFTDFPRAQDIGNIKSYFTQITGPLGERPFTLTTFALNYAISGTGFAGHNVGSTGFHVVNIALHLLNTVLVYAFVLLTGGLAGIERRVSVPAAFLTSAAFVLHPLQTEAVTYLVTRSMLITTALYLGGIMLFVRASRVKGMRCVPYWLGILAISFLGVSAREDFATFPAVLALYDLFFISRFSMRGVLRKWTLYVAAMLPFAYMAFLVTSWDMYGADAGFKVKSATPLQYLMTQFNVQWTYLRMFVLPFNQNLDYDYPVSKTLLELPTMFSFIGYLALWVAALVTTRKRPLISFSILWFLITITPASSFVPLVDRMFEHRVYLPSVGVFGIMTMGVFYVFGKLRHTWARAGLTAAVVCVLLAFGVTAYARNALWTNQVSMWEDVVLKSPNKARPHNNLGNAYQTWGLAEKAEQQFRRAIQLDPYYADPHTNLGSILYRRGEYREAADNFKFSVYAKPESAENHLNLGLALTRLGEFTEAKKQFRAAASIKPYPEALYDLAVVYVKEGNKEKAIIELKKALSINPYHARARGLLESLSTGSQTSGN